MASSCISLCGFRNPYFTKLKVKLPPQASFRDEVDANMSALRCRIEQVRMKERLALNSSYKQRGHGWNYRPGYDDVLKKQKMLITSFQLLTIVVYSIGLVFLAGSLCIFLVFLTTWTN